jgi:hypothetical protein
VSSERAAAADGSAIARLARWVEREDARALMASVTTIMKLNDEYEDFEVKLDRVHPSYNETLAVLLFDKDGDPA